MKKNLAKRIVLGLLTGAVLMSSSVAWAGYSVYTFTDNNNTIENSFGVGCDGKNNETITPGKITSDAKNSIVIGIDSHISSEKSVALGNNAEVRKANSVALGYGSVADASNVVSVGSGNVDDAYATRKIVNVTKGELDTDAVNVGQLNAVANIVGTGKVVTDSSGITCITNGETLTDTVRNLANTVQGNWTNIYNITGSGDFKLNTTYITNSEDLTDAAKDLDAQVKINADAIADKADKKYVDENFVRITTFENQNIISSSITIQENNSAAPITIGAGGITVGEHSTHMDEEGFYACDNGNHTYAGANAAMSKDGKIKGAGGKFEVGADGSVKAAGDKFKVDKDGNVSAEKITAKEVEAENLYTKEQVNELIGGSNASVAGLNQRLEKTNAKINKVGAGAAALAALHPLDYDPDDKLTFSAGMGNYAGENAAALGAFYRPNEKFMLSLGGTMGNGENMVNLGLSIGLDKPNGFAKMSKRELIQEVNAVKAENEAIKADNEAMKDQLANADERIAKLEALVAQLASK
ncbi:MAG: YadA-like family protein [Phascolarctobacterium sp.]|nr:YadA-like family protein [Phascolarctobacterium sp.]MBO5404185.1 YadA-like family protein [Phascolarctobacterium sp.]